MLRKIMIGIALLITLVILGAFRMSAEETGRSEMVLIPGGEFVMGEDGDASHSPAHEVYVDAFYMDKFEVTNFQYFNFCKVTDKKLPEFWGMEEFHSGEDYPNHPVVGVNSDGAKAYSEWAGKRLPTEAEWEYAARGGLVGKKYPNGDDIDSATVNHTIKGVTLGSMPVGSYPPNGYGLYDMSGNVNEWVADYFDGEYYATSPDKNPKGPEEGKFRVIRGGGWHTGPYCNRVYFRNALPPNWVDINVGFRCVKDVE